MQPLSIYLHVPFCRHRCSYCDFNTYTSIGDLQEDYVQALDREIHDVASLAENAGQLRPVNTIFFGGGTPSLLTANQVRRLLAAVRDTFGFSDDIEITLEANPEGLSADYLGALRTAGVNRLSFGMQSGDATELALLGREHGIESVNRAVALARSVGYDNYNLDLIYGLPGQKLATWRRSLQMALDNKPTHLSLYCLTIERGTPMHNWLAGGHIPVPDPDMAAEQYELACGLLSDAGFEHYEISNWSRPGFACQHNLAYWRDREYLGLGAGAHGKAAGYRYALVRRPRTYIRRIFEGESYVYPMSAAAVDMHIIDQREAMSDRVITQLRLLLEGLDLPTFEREFGVSLQEAFDGVAEQLVDWGLLVEKGTRLFLTPRGRFISNQVFYRFV